MFPAQMELTFFYQDWNIPHGNHTMENSPVLLYCDPNSL